MNEITIKFLLAGDTFMPKTHLSQPEFASSACRPFTKNKERIKKSTEKGESRYIYQNQVDKACFQHYMAYGDFKDLCKRTTSDEVLSNKTFSFSKNPKYDDIKEVFVQWFINVLIRSLLVLILQAVACAPSETIDRQEKSAIENQIMSNQHLAEELQKPSIRKFEKRKVYSSSKDNI